MIERIKKLMAVSLASFTLLMPGIAIPALGGALATAAITTSVCDGAGEASGEPKDCKNATLSGSSEGIKDLAGTVVDIFSVIIGAIAIIMLLYGGLRYITSGGDSGRVGNAKNTLLYAVIGLIIVALAQIIVNFVLSASNTAGSELID